MLGGCKKILGLGPGEVFVHRNVGNLVPGNDLNAMSVLEYAVGHLDVQDILVVGHYDCGAIRAATSRQDLGKLNVCNAVFVVFVILVSFFHGSLRRDA